MDRSVAMLLIGLLFGGGIGFTIAAGAGITLDGHDHSNPAHHGAPAVPAGATAGDHAGHAGHTGPMDHAGHDHDTPVVVPAGANAPSLSVLVTEDSEAGWNVQLVTSDFTFTAENAGAAHVLGEGHAHLYVNGKKLMRVYGEWAHVSGVPAGATLTVTLNANDHRPYKVGDDLLSVDVTLPSS